MCVSESRGDCPVLTLDVHAHDGSRPIQEIGDHNANPLTRSRRCSDQHPLLASKSQITTPQLSKNDALFTKQAGIRNLRPSREAGFTMQGPRTRDENDETRERDKPKAGHETPY